MDAPASEVVLDAGRRLRFDRLLLATGAAPRRLDVPGAGLDGVHYLRDIEDSDAIAERLEQGGRVVVVGGGWISSEVAASARQKGLEVTVLMEEDAPLVRQLGPEVGAVYRDLHRERGVEFVTASVAAFEGQKRSGECGPATVAPSRPTSSFSPSAPNQEPVLPGGPESP